ncbi:hypothetical protein HK097_009912 [Rhizophlyctis rosea]|uniref:Uncharacterized protein n=1 Tax=Rhizophlyctis rosea TaxID=64517 RepID=A0AAD5X8V1_9FUNG|nr:hypothetical protein HK097_009912 [Rhizophlyctis rosea]
MSNNETTPAIQFAAAFVDTSVAEDAFRYSSAAPAPQLSLRPPWMPEDNWQQFRQKHMSEQEDKMAELAAAVERPDNPNNTDWDTYRTDKVAEVYCQYLAQALQEAHQAQNRSNSDSSNNNSILTNSCPGVSLGKIHPVSHLLGSIDVFLKLALEGNNVTAPDTTTAVPSKGLDTWLAPWDIFKDAHKYIYSSHLPNLENYEREICSLVASCFSWHRVYTYDKARRSWAENHKNLPLSHVDTNLCQRILYAPMLPDKAPSSVRAHP